MATRKPPTANAFRCTECGWTTVKWVGRCGECQQWGTVVESAAPTGIVRSVTAIAPGRSAQPITSIDTADTPRRSSGVGEFDRVLGGGIVPGAAILLSGEPGVGKSTLLIEVAAQSARSGRRVLYVSAEESLGQVRLRAERTGALHDELYLAAETDLATVLGHVDEVRPDLLIVDSVQTVASAQTDGMAGHPSQVREVASTLIRIAKERDLPVVIVGHVTKDGSIAGPRILEHLVDVVCHFEGDRQTSLRFVRALKNRFGATDEVGCFDMTGAGITEVPDPSALFLGHGSQAAGTCVTIAMEGRRAIPVEVQALTLATKSPNPRRVVSGIDGARVSMVLAVLAKRAGINLSEHEVYVSTVGGVRLTEPAADLAIALALASAYKGRANPRQLAAIGELSLAGEIRAVTQHDQRRAEAARLGYRTLIDRRADTLEHALEQRGLLGPSGHSDRSGRPERPDRSERPPLRPIASITPDDFPGF